MTSKTLGRNATAAGALIGVVASLLFVTGSLEGLEKRIYDARLASSATGNLSPAFVVVGITPSDIGKFGVPDGASIARLVDRLQELGASDVVVDIPIVETDTKLDQLAAAASEGNVVFAYQYPSDQAIRLERGQTPEPILLPKPIADVAEGVGFTNRLPGPDGVLRRFSPQAGDDIEIALAAAATVEGGSPKLPKQAPMVGETIRFGPGPRLLIRYDVQPRDLRFYSMADVIETGGAFAGKTAIVGLVDPRYSAIYQTPLGPMPHAFITAEIASAIVQGRGITRSPLWLVVVAVILVSMSLSIGSAQARPIADVLLPIVAGFLIWVFSGIAFRSGTWVDVLPLAVVLVLHTASMPVLRRAFLASAQGMNRTEANKKRFAETLLEILTLGSFAHSGKIWLIDAPEKAVLVSIGEVPEHLSAAIPPSEPKEANRDEGQVVLLPVEVDSQKVAGCALIRRRSAPFAVRRLRLLKRTAETFMSQLPAARADHTGQTLMNCLFEVASYIDTQERFSPAQAERFAEMVRGIGRSAGLDEEQLDSVVVAARLHDLGNIGVRDAVLDSNARLTDDEYEQVKKHPLVTRQILEAARADREVIRIVTSHHERWDGRGYPERKSGEDIPLGARILAMADAIASMTSDRPYRQAIPLDAALEEVKRQSGRMFDPHLVDICLDLARSKPELFAMSGELGSSSDSKGVSPPTK